MEIKLHCTFEGSEFLHVVKDGEEFQVTVVHGSDDVALLYLSEADMMKLAAYTVRAVHGDPE